MVSYVPPTVAGDAATWGTKLNAALAAIAAAVDTNTAALAALNPGASNPVVATFELGTPGETSIVVTWTAPATTDARGVATGYALRTASPTSFTLISHVIAESPLTVGGLDSGTAYTMTITPFYSDGTFGNPTTRTFTTATPSGGAGDMPNGNSGTTFDGSLYYDAADHNDFTIVTTNAFTWECWIWLTSVNQTVNTDHGTGSSVDSEKRIHYLNKGAASNYEWAARYYSMNSSATDRLGGFSNYAFALAGGNGVGAKAVPGGSIPATTAGTWMHIMGTINVAGNCELYKNGVRGGTHQDYDTQQSDGTIVSAGDGNGTAKVCIGGDPTWGGTTSRLQGKMAKVAIYNRELSQQEAIDHYDAMLTGNSTAYDTAILAESGLIAYWKLDPSAPTVDSVPGNAHPLTFHPS